MSQKGYLAWGAAALALFLAACGGGGGGGSESGGGSTSLSGFVEDGPIERARVSLQDSSSGEILRVCGASGVGRCETVTDATGAFFLRVRDEALTGALELVASGGTDTETGVSFDGMSLRAPVELFRGFEENIAVTPLTSVLASRMRQGADLAAARREVAIELGIAEGDFLARPSSHPELQSRALLLTGIAMEMVDAGNADPFGSLGKRGASGASVLVNGEANLARREEWGLDEAAGQRLENLGRSLKTGENLAVAFRRAALLKGIQKAVAALIGESPGHDPKDPDLRRNIETLAEKTLQAAGAAVVPLRGITTQRLARYVLFTYGLVSVGPDDAVSFAPLLENDSSRFAASLVHPETGGPLAEDPRIAELATAWLLNKIPVPLYDPSVPLLKGELPGNDNLKRVSYFYNSDLSPFYQAESLTGEISDDRISDPLMLEIAKEKAAAGLIEEARLIVDTQIFQPDYKAEGYIAVAKKEIEYGRKESALETLTRGEAQAKKVIAAKGAGSADSSDITDLQEIGSGFRKAGDLAGAQRITGYLNGLVATDSSVLLYGSILVGTWKVADDHLDAGRREEALDLVRFMEKLAPQTPANRPADGKISYQGKILYLMETARRYARLGIPEKVGEIFALVQTIRANDGFQNLTAGLTWSTMIQFVEILYQVGMKEQAVDLANQMPGPHDVKALKLVATYEALQSGAESGISVVHSRFATTADKIEALTYFATNENREYIALALIQAGRFEEARRALDLAVSLVGELKPTSESALYSDVVQKGYVKMAGLYTQVGDRTKALAMLARAESTAATLVGAQPFVNSMVDIFSAYTRMDLFDRADLLQASADRVASSGAIPPLDRAVLLDKIIKTALLFGRIDLASPLIDEMGRSSLAISNDPVKRTNQLILTAKHAARVEGPAAADRWLKEATTAADGIFVPADRTNKLIEIVSAYAVAGDLKTSLGRARDEKVFPTVYTRNRALEAVVKTLASRNDFASSTVATIDTDRDGKPDFFHPFVSAEAIAASGLVLDDDSDGDGIPDAEDRRPLFPDDLQS